MEVQRFRDRAHAGRLLAERLRRYAGRDDVIVLGLPRGGVPVAAGKYPKWHLGMDDDSPSDTKGTTSSLRRVRERPPLRRFARQGTTARKRPSREPSATH